MRAERIIQQLLTEAGRMIRQTGPIADRLFEIEFLDAGAELFAFTFG